MKFIGEADGRRGSAGSGRLKVVHHKRMTLRVASVAAALLFPVLAGSAVAQTAPQSVPQGSPLPRVLPPGPAATSPGAATPALFPSGAEVPNRSVLVTDVAIEGATAFPQSELASYTAGLTGPAVPLPKIDAARQAILKHYRSQGYVLTTVSVSLNAAGHLRFIITEGHTAASSSTAISAPPARASCASCTSSLNTRRSIPPPW